MISIISLTPSDKSLGTYEPYMQLVSVKPWNPLVKLLTLGVQECGSWQHTWEVHLSRELPSIRCCEKLLDEMKAWTATHRSGFFLYFLCFGPPKCSRIRRYQPEQCRNMTHAHMTLTTASSLHTFSLQITGCGVSKIKAKLLIPSTPKQQLCTVWKRTNFRPWLKCQHVNWYFGKQQLQL